MKHRIASTSSIYIISHRRRSLRPLRLNLFFLLCLLISGFSFQTPAHAACGSPAGSAGDMIYNGGYTAWQYCNGTNWTTMGPVGNTTAGLVGWWKLDDGSSGTTPATAADSTGNGNTGTLTNSPVWTSSGMNGNALTFNSGTQYVNVGNPASLQIAGDITMCAWAYPTASTTFVFSKSDATTYDYDMYITMDGYLSLYYGAGTNVSSNPAQVSLNAWNHLCTVVQSTNVTFYINGVAHAGGTATITNNNKQFSIGQQGSNPNLNFLGTIDDLRIYNRALSASDIRTLYTSTGGGSGDINSNLVGYWKLDEGAGTAAADSSANGYTGTLHGTALPVWTASGKVNGALTFDGVNDYVDAGNDAQLAFGTGDLSLSLWVKTTGYVSQGSSVNAIASQGALDATASQGFLTQSDNLAYFEVGGTGAGSGLVSGGYIGDNAWHHLVGVRQSGTICIYTDGVRGNCASGVTNSITLGSMGNFYIGSDSSTIRYIKGTIDDVRVYSRALSASDVLTLYNSTATSCASPAGYAGDLRYNAGTNHVMQYCDGSVWQPLGPVPGTGGGGCSNPSRAEGVTIYNNDFSTMQYCDGAKWIAMGGPPSVTCTPANAYSFTNLTNQNLSALVTSNIVQITGLACATGTTISGTGSPQFQICGSSDSTCASPLFTWGSTAQNIFNNQYLQLRLTTSASQNTALTATPSVNGVTTNWSATTLTCDSTPTAFSFTDVTSQPLSTSVQSNILQITGISAFSTGCATAISVSGAGSAQYRVCADGTCSANPAFTASAGTIDNNQYVQAQVTTSAANNTGANSTVTVGTGSDTYTATTCNNPNAFAFTDVTNQALSTSVQSNIVQITGTAGCTFTTSVSGDATAKYRVCGDSSCSAAPAFIATASTIAVNSYIQAQVTNSASNFTAVNATVGVGASSSDTYTSTTLRVIKKVFVTSATYTPQTAPLTSYANANTECGTRAAAGTQTSGLGGTWKAWIANSTAGNNPNGQFSGVGGAFEYQETDGTVIADGWSALTTPNLSHAIDRDENGTLQSGASNVWTDVTITGTTTSTNTNTATCGDWNNSTKSGDIGSSNAVAAAWTNAATGQACNVAKRLYCFQQ